jgi:L-lactate dehydrogenase complex protein LldG
VADVTPCWPASASRSDAPDRAATRSCRCPAPAFEGDVVERFVVKMLEKAATLAPVASLAEVGAEVARFVASVQASPRLCVSKALATIDWPPGFDVAYRAARRTDETSVTPCYAAVAESGGIVTLSGPDTPSTLNFVPDNHIVVVHAVQVVPHFEDVWARWRAAGRPLPRTVNIISGPSRTADIEMTIQLGAHGPRRLHIVLVTA